MNSQRDNARPMEPDLVDDMEEAQSGPLDREESPQEGGEKGLVGSAGE